MGFDFTDLIKPVNECVCLILACKNSCETKLAARARRDSCQSQSVLAHPEQPFLPSSSRFLPSILKKIIVDGIDDCKQKVSLDLLLAIITQIREKTHNLPVTLNLLQNTFDSQFWAHLGRESCKSFLNEVLLL